MNAPKSFLSITLASFLALSAGRHAKGFEYILVDLTPDAEPVYAAGINSSGQVVGTVGDARAFRTAPNGVVDANSYLTPPSVASAAYAINDSGQVVGWAKFGAENLAFRTTATGVVDSAANLHEPHQGYSRDSIAYAINASGETVGGWGEFDELNPGNFIGGLFRTSATGKFSSSSNYLGGGAENLNGINDSGQVVYTKRVGNENHAFRDSLDLGPGWGEEAVVTAINASGQVVGYSSKIVGGNSHYRAFRSSASGALVNFGTLGGTSSFANAINASGEVVGWSRASDDSENRAIIVDATGTMKDLNSLIPAGTGWHLEIATGINDSEQIVGTMYRVGTNQARWHAFRLDPVRRKPVIFLHGIAGSKLKAGDDQIWPTLSPFDVQDLALLQGSPNAEAVDVVPEYHGNVYNLFLDHMVNDLGYEAYDLAEDRSRLTSNHMLNSLNGAKPNLFVFPYDWRRDNATHTATLKAYIDKIRELHNGSKVQIVAHSMGGLVTRRFLLDYGSEDVDKVVTVGSPLWGAVKPIYLLLTGFFYESLGGTLDFINGDEMKASLATMPGLHQLLPAPPFLSRSSGLFWENGWDYDGDGDATEGPYSTSQLYALIDDTVLPTPSASQTNQTFHNHLGGRQDDWSADTTDGPGILHFVGIQSVNKTVTSVSAGEFVLYSFNYVPHRGTRIDTHVGEGDGTVPTLSARRLPEFLAPTAVVHEIREPRWSPSDSQPVGRSAEHTKLMSNHEVWDKMSRFLGTGPWPPTQAPPSPPPSASAAFASMGNLDVAPSGTPPEIVVEQPDGTGLVDGGATVDFGTLRLSSSGDPVVFTIRNSGGEDLTGLSVTKDGANSADYTVGSLGATTVLPGESTTFTVTFAPGTGGGHRGGVRTAALHIASNDADENPFDINLTGTVAAGQKQVFVVGVSYIKIRNAAGDANTKLSDIAALRVPGVEVQYGGSQPWVELSFGADENITLERDPAVTPFGPMDIAVTEFDSAGTAFSFQRYRFSPGSQSWQVVIAPELQPDMRVDQNDDSTYAPGEAVVPTHSNTGNTVDATSPSVTLTLADNANGIVLSLVGQDGTQPVPSLRYSLDEGPVQAYSSQLLFPKGETRVVKAFAEDAMGNTSGLIQTTINPAVAIGAGAVGEIQLEWPASDGYILEESTTLAEPWASSSATVTRSGMTHRATIPVGGDSQKFFRLRSVPVAH